MKVTVEQIAPERAEEVLLRCHDPKDPWVGENPEGRVEHTCVIRFMDGKLGETVPEKA